MHPDDHEPPRSRSERGPGLAVLAAAMLLASAAPAAANDAAHRLAERFAGASRAESGSAPAAAAIANPATSRDTAADAQSRAEALAAARAAKAARQQAQARRREAERRAAELKADEARMLEQARVELDQFRAEERAAQAVERAAVEALSAMGPHPAEIASDAAPEERPATAMASTPAEPSAAAAPVANSAAHDVAALEAQREDEGRRLEDKLAKVRQSRLGGSGGAATAPPASADETAAGEAARVASPAAADAVLPETAASGGVRDGAVVSSVMVSDTVTILLALEPGSTGIRRHNATADPVICIGADCYVSEGAGLTARKVTRGQVAGPGLTLGQRAGACNQRTACAFRNIALPANGAMLQPIDLRLLRHDRREEARIAVDPSCALQGGRLGCRALVRGPDWIAWVVPEAVAAQAGADVLETALAHKLGAERTAVLRPVR